MVDSNYNFSEKSFKLEKLIIYPSSGKSIDITNMVDEITIFEDIFSATMSGKVIISDGLELIPSLPIIGQEYLVIEFSKPDELNPIEEIFRIFSVEKPMIDFNTMNSQQYTINFCAEEVLLSEQSLISKSYRGKSIKDIVEDILKNKLLANPKKLLAKNIEPTNGQTDIIIANKRPLDALFWLSHRAKNSKNEPGFLFFQNREGFNFKSIGTLFRGTSYTTYSYKPKNVSDTDNSLSDEIRNIIRYEFVSMFDSLEGIRKGLFSSSLLTIDLLRQKFENYSFDYYDTFKNIPHIISGTPGPFETGMNNRFGKPPSKNYGGFYRYFPTTKGHSSVPNITQKQPNLKENQVEDWLLQRASQLKSLNFFRLKIVVPGDVKLKVGDIINVSVPLISQKLDNGGNINPYFSGKCLITAIRHIITLNKYEMILELTKDTLSRPFPDSDNKNVILAKIKSY